jgi:hypothetical protein
VACQRVQTWQQLQVPIKLRQLLLLFLLLLYGYVLT